VPGAPRSLSLAPDEPFRLVGGHVAADLVNTVDWTAAGPARDRLVDYARVVAWAVAAGAIDGSTARRLRAAGERQPAVSRAAHERALWLRDVLRRLFGAVADGGVHSTGGRRALDEFDELLHAALVPLHLAAPGTRRADADGSAAIWRWRGADDRPEAVLWPVAWQAARLLASPDASRLRVCAGVDCGWVYVDRSRNGLRRWCEMETCGTLEKSRRRADRARGAGR